ncbi:hypothetical protein GQ457_17G003810 [Hibiscus cannabinus]
MELSMFSVIFCFIGLALFPTLYVQSAQTVYPQPPPNATVTASSNGTLTVVSQGPAAPGDSVPTVVSQVPAATVGGVPTDVAHGPAVVAPSPSTDSALGVMVVGLIGGAGALIFGIGSIWFILRRRRNKANKFEEDIIDGKFQNGMGHRKFSLVQIAKMTSNFKAEKLGKGGFGDVFRGYLRDLDTNVAVKRISKASKQGIKEYASEVKIISRLRHKNLVKLIGKSLLTWDVRYRIVHGLSSALFYLHEEGDHCILHRDIKASNIILDSGFNAKLGDFGLARVVDHAKGSQTTHLAGTLGYMAPECVSSGKASKEADVYSFGVVALEIACGRRSIEPTYEESRASLVAWVWDLFGNRQLLGAADPKLSMDFDTKEMECLLMVGLWCVHPDPKSRPSIRQTIQVLNFEAPLPKLPSARPTPTYGVPIGSGIQASDPCFSSVSITIPR